MLKKIWKLIFGEPAPPPEPFNDPILGTMEFDDLGWQAKVKKDGDDFTITVGGDDRPDEKILAHAHDIVANYKTFKKMIRDFLTEESREWPDPAKEIVATFEIYNVYLPYPVLPNDGMVSFKSPHAEFVCWRCDYIAGKPKSLGCDT